MDIMDIFVVIIQLLIVMGSFALIIGACRYVINYIKSNHNVHDSKFLNPIEYFPHEKVLTLQQVFYLIMIMIFLILDLYLIFNWGAGSYYIFLIDIIISIYLALNISGNSYKNYLILFALIPFGSIYKLAFGDTSVVLYDIFHMIGYLYFIHLYYRKFVKHTENNGLGITIMLLFSIILVSFLFTMLVENVSPLDSITMVSNAFTSNSFDAAGNTSIGKLNSLVLAWGGFILSGVGTATLSVSIVQRYIDREFDQMEELIKSKKKEK